MRPPSQRAAFVTHLLAVDAALGERGFPRLSPWWREQLLRFLRTGALAWVVRVGRRGGKSSTWCKLAVAWALFGPWSVPPGDAGVVAFVSVSRDEASQRLRTITKMLDALGVSYDRRGDEVELRDRPVVFKVMTCATSGVVGFTSIMVVGDELARWRDTEGTTNPAREVVGTLRPTLATTAGSGCFMVLSSSPVSTTDYHAEAFALGDTDAQVTSFAPTWVANPTVTEQQTKDLEPDERVWSREYGAEPSAHVSAAFTDGVDNCVSLGVRRRPYARGTRYLVTFDLGDQRSASAALVAHFEHRQSGQAVQRVLVVDAVRLLKPKLFRKVTFDMQKQMLAELCAEFKVDKPLGDRHRHGPLGDELRKINLSLPDKPAGMHLEAQAQRATELLERVRAGSVDLLDDPDLREQLNNAVVRERDRRFVITTANKRSQPDDLLDCLLLACDEGFRSLPASAGDVGFAWSDSGERVFFRVREDGSRVPCSPPQESDEWLLLVQRSIDEGFSTVEIEEWLSHPTNVERFARWRETNASLGGIAALVGSR